MKSCVVSTSIGLGNIYDKVIGTHIDYCKKYNLEYFLKTEFDEDDLLIPYKDARDDKKAAWTKITSCLKKLKEGYDWVLWVDCDVQTRLTAPDFRSVEKGGKYIYVTPHNEGDKRVNAGVMMFKNHPICIDYLEKILSECGNKIPEDYNIKYENGHVNYYSTRHKYRDYVEKINIKWNSCNSHNYFNHVFGALTFNEKKNTPVDNLLNNYYFYSKLNPNLEKYRDIHKGETAYLIGNGPTVKRFYKIADTLEGVKIATNGSIYTDLKADYLMVSDPPRKVDGKRVWSKFLNEWHLYKRFPVVILKDYIIRDSGLIDGSIETYRSRLDCMNGFNKDISVDIGSNVSVGHDMLQFILYTGVSTLYIVGCDCSVSGFDPGDDKKKWLGDISMRKADQLLECWKVAKKWADKEYPDVEIKVVNPVRLDLWEGVEL